MSKAIATRTSNTDDARGKSHGCNRQAEYHQQEEHAIDEDAQRGDSWPKSHRFIEHRDQTESVSAHNFSRENLDSRDVNRPHHNRQYEHQKREARGENRKHIDIGALRRFHERSC